MIELRPEDVITTDEELRAIVPGPGQLVLRKELTTLDEHARRFIARSPFLVLASTAVSGRADASPRGDPPGFVRVLDATTLFVPERPGNRRLDTLRNVLANPQVGILFLVPGMTETLRVNGRASIVRAPALLAAAEVSGRRPTLGLLVEVQEVFFHCSRAFLRGGVWDHERWPATDDMPSLGTVLADQARIDGLSAEELDEDLAESDRRLY